MERNISITIKLRNDTGYSGAYKYSSLWLKTEWMYWRNKSWSERVSQGPNPKGLLATPNAEWLALKRPSLHQESGAFWKGKHNLHPGICACCPILCEFQGWSWSVSTVWFGCSLLCNRFSQLLIIAPAFVMAMAVNVSSGVGHAPRLVITAAFLSVVSVGWRVLSSQGEENENAVEYQLTFFSPH